MLLKPVPIFSNILDSTIEYFDRNQPTGDDHRRLLISYLLYTLLILFLGWVSLADASTGVKMEKVRQGTLFYTSTHDIKVRIAPMLNTNINMHITGIINHAHMDQTFQNDSDDWLEGIYVFPLPENAAVDHIRILIGNHIIEGKLKPRTEAKKVYETARSQGKYTSLLEKNRPTMLTTSVANIGPHEKVTIEVEFQQVLRYYQGEFHLRFPLAITPRYIPGNAVKTGATKVNSWPHPTDQVSDADQVTPVVGLDRKVNPVSLHIELDAGFPVNSIQSPYYAINSRLIDEGHYRITLARDRKSADRDFELIWSPVPGSSPRTSVFREHIGNDYYYLVMMLPPDVSDYNQQVMAKEVIYIIDTSGSMEGISIRQACKALLVALDHLRSQDSFNIIQFNSVISKLFEEPMPASLENVTQAQHYIKHLTAGGGTEMMPAMRAALSSHTDSLRLRQTIFLTDGVFGNENTLFGYIRQHLGNSRLFTIGIGSAPNSFFMTKAAQSGRGTFTNISVVNDVISKMKALFAKLDSPVMRDLTITHHLGDFEMWPQTLPDLYSEEPVIFTARSQNVNGEIQLFGQRNDERWQTSFYLQNATTGAGIGKLWARNKISALIGTLHDGANEDSVRNKVTQLALDHNLVSEYTSLVAVDVTSIRPGYAALSSKAVPTNLPKGQSGAKIFDLQARTGTDQYQLIVTGMLLMTFALGLALVIRREGEIWAS